MHQELFVSTSVIGALYFLTSRRCFDYYTIAYFGSLAYFLPGFFGYTAFHIGGVWSENEINNETYLVLITVTTSIWLCAQIGSNIRNPIKTNIRIPNKKFPVNALLFLSTLGATILVLSAGNSIHDADKTAVMENLGRWHILFYSAAALGLPLSYATKQYKALFLFFCLLCFDLYLGFRSTIAISIISLITVHLASKSKLRLASEQLKIILLMLFIGAFFFLYKVIAFSVKSGMWDLVIDRLSDGNTYAIMITRSEPFVIQQILNEVISKDFRVDIINVLSAFNQFILFGPEIGLGVSSFNDLFQPTLFPSVEYGMASNIWAQMWSAGGWGLLLFFIILFNLTLAVGNATLKSPSPIIRAGFAPAFVYWAFYIHRNDISYAINIEKRLLLILVGCVLFSYILHYLSKGRLRSHSKKGSMPFPVEIDFSTNMMIGGTTARH